MMERNSAWNCFTNVKRVLELRKNFREALLDHIQIITSGNGLITHKKRQLWIVSLQYLEYWLRSWWIENVWEVRNAERPSIWLKCNLDILHQKIRKIVCTRKKACLLVLGNPKTLIQKDEKQKCLGRDCITCKIIYPLYGVLEEVEIKIILRRFKVHEMGTIRNFWNEPNWSGSGIDFQKIQQHSQKTIWTHWYVRSELKIVAIKPKYHVNQVIRRGDLHLSWEDSVNAVRPHYTKCCRTLPSKSR